MLRAPGQWAGCSSAFPRGLWFCFVTPLAFWSERLGWLLPDFEIVFGVSHYKKAWASERKKGFGGYR